VSNNWNYVIVGYAITVITLVAYLAWVKARTRKLRRSLRDEDNG
jgi:heme exporter protein CcmD